MEYPPTKEELSEIRRSPPEKDCLPNFGIHPDKTIREINQNPSIPKKEKDQIEIQNFHKVYLKIFIKFIFKI